MRCPTGQCMGDRLHRGLRRQAAPLPAGSAKPNRLPGNGRTAGSGGVRPPRRSPCSDRLMAPARRHRAPPLGARIPAPGARGRRPARPTRAIAAIGLRSASRRPWRRSKRCANIQTGPRNGSRSVVPGANAGELGQHVPMFRDEPSEVVGKLDAEPVADSIAGTLSIAVTGSTWAVALLFLETQPYVFGTGGNYPSVLSSIIDGALKTQRPRPPSGKAHGARWASMYRDLSAGPTARRLALRIAAGSCA